MQKQTPPLALCVLLDLLGNASYLVPALGELFDVVWAPISAILFFVLFRGKKRAVGAVVSFIEEALPFVDIIPTFTIAWFLQNRQPVYKSNTSIRL